ncbi:DUF4232 domain-containing protein [Streptomyces rhizosphaerihabitans]|uniref:DUF4232 domain-containing protein n=1 Tax=Streptomyces rhizosphaerihabitans TaxID=1266770 RepID=UPI0021BF0C95|nr:DUF4232 domain-containing protein [Streptomyces rhizosphaerihabitans]MCT9006313.1 DUF4232 domain-containing protein [Streptomyces rhizosphaerihabitans]
MRALPIAVTALAAALALTSCDGGGSSSSSGKSGDSAGSAKKAAVAACVIGDAGIQVGPANAATAAGDTGNIPVTLTNKGAQCTLKGFPGLSVQAGDTSADIAADKSAAPEQLTLAEGDTASFTITYVRGAAGDAKTLAVKTLKISLPGAGTTQSFPWSYGPVAGKGSASEPNASVTPFQHAGD